MDWKLTEQSKVGGGVHLHSQLRKVRKSVASTHRCSADTRAKSKSLTKKAAKGITAPCNDATCRATIDYRKTSIR
jgi:hypothetical protein